LKNFNRKKVVLINNSNQGGTMKRILPVVLTLSALTFLAGCEKSADKFEILRAGNQTFVLNKSNGEAQVIEGTSLIKVKAPESVGTDQVSSQVKSWPIQTIAQLGNLKLEMRSKYRDGRMMYSIEATPYQGILEKAFTGNSADYLHQPTIYIDLNDTDGFPTGETIELKIRGGGGTRIVDEKGEAYAVSWVGSQPMSLDTYRASAIQSVRWGAFSKE
jgi:hypothetical protein